MHHQKYNSVTGRHYSGILYREYGWDYHFHNSFELIYVLEGKLEVLVNHVQIGLGEQEFLLIAPGMVHSCKW